MVIFALCVLLRAALALWTDPASDYIGSATCQLGETLASPGPVDWQPADPRKGLTLTELWQSNAWTALDFGITPLYAQSARFLKLHNPSDRPVRVQAFLLLDPEILDKKLQVPSYDEDEIFTAPDKAEQPSDSLRVIQEASSRTPAPNPTAPAQLSLLDKLRLALGLTQPLDLAKLRTSVLPRFVCERECKWIPSESSLTFDLLSNLSQAFYLSPQTQGVYFLPPGGCMHLGPILFNPTGIGNYTSVLLVRLKSGKHDSIIHRVELRGEGEFSRLAFQAWTTYRKTGQYHQSTLRGLELSSLEFNVSQEDLRDVLTVHNGEVRLPQAVTFTRRFEAQNVGSIPLFITQVSIEGQGCERFGVLIHDCDSPIRVEPRGTVAWNVSYTTEFRETEVQTRLWVQAAEAFFYIPLEVTVKLGDLVRWAEWKGRDVDSWDYFTADTALLVQIVLATGCLLAIGKDAVWPTPSLRVSIKSSREVVKRTYEPLHEMSHSPHFSATLVPLPLPTPSQFPTSPPPPLDEIPKKQEVCIKPRKVKKPKASVLKFAPKAPQNADNSEGTALFATKQPCAKVKRSKSEEDQGSESFTTTHTEEELEDVYLDDFKTRQGLFNGFSFA